MITTGLLGGSFNPAHGGHRAISLDAVSYTHLDVYKRQTQDRAAVGALLRAQGLIDIIIPRGGKGLVARVQDEARVPVLAHLDGINHLYIDGAADPARAVDLAVNAKMRRTGVCGATETILIDRAYPCLLYTSRCV